MQFVDNRRVIYKQNDTLYLLDCETRTTKPVLRSESDVIDSYVMSPNTDAIHYTTIKVEADVWPLSFD